MDIRETVQRRLDRMGWSAYRLVAAVHGRVTDRVVYSWLAGTSRINSDALGHILDAVGLRIVDGRKPPTK